MLSFKRKEKFDNYSIRGMVYAGIAILGIGCELIFSQKVRILLIIAYSIIVVFGMMYIWYIKPHEQN